MSNKHVRALCGSTKQRTLPRRLENDSAISTDTMLFGKLNTDAIAIWRHVDTMKITGLAGNADDEAIV